MQYRFTQTILHSRGDDDFLLALLPIAYATMKMDKLTESLDSSDIALSKDLESRMEYVLGDIQ